MVVMTPPLRPALHPMSTDDLPPSSDIAVIILRRHPAAAPIQTAASCLMAWTAVVSGRRKRRHGTFLDPASGRPAVEGTRGVFHLASPFILCKQRDPENELLEPVVKGTLNVLRAAAMVPNPNWPADKVVYKDCCAVVELLKKVQFWYSVLDFAGKEGLQWLCSIQGWYWVQC
uniref:Uncharacterized protein n=1 Tax=Setaria viridis TaxID=4556 RepID=A0A4U6SZG2_SETVI|nr:hypothetical protein SEVIR_9G299500v2 [Setaria viridis]TKV94500.1 hypothetical protein SEVIR_9G299500v2 [Setaria viridis]